MVVRYKGVWSIQAVLLFTCEFSQKRICARNKAKGCTMPKDLKLFYFAFFLMRGRAKKILVFMIRNSSCKFDNVANVYV